MKVQLLNQVYNYPKPDKVKFTSSPGKFLITSPAMHKEMQALGLQGQYLAFRGKADRVNLMEVSKKTNVGLKLAKLRHEMQKANLDALVVRSTDEYLNETVDKNQSQRIYISDFTGSAGDIIITRDQAYLMVDSRYHTQAGQEVDSKYYKVEKIGLNDKGEKIEELPYHRMVSVLTKLSKDNPLKVGIDPEKFSINYHKALINKLEESDAKVELVPTEGNLIDKIRGGKPPAKVKPVKHIATGLTGETTRSKLDRLEEKLDEDNVDVMVVDNLCDISYLTNLRGADIDYSAVFKSRALVANDKLFVFCEPSKVSSDIRKELKGDVVFKPVDKYFDTLKEIINSADKELKIAFSPRTSNYDTYLKLKELAEDKAELVEIKENPIALMRSVKNDIELASMKDGMNRADRAVADVINWINTQIKEGNRITEQDLEDKTREAHFKHGANALSFEIIPGTGPNGAIVHYSKADPNKEIKLGELVLLDTGGYYEAGYATDLTRSWMAGGDFAARTLEKTDIKDLEKKKEIYSTVLKGSLKGLFAELPPWATGQYLDYIVRKPIQDLGYDFGHSTGHGVGIAVHESPPSITPSASGDVKLKEGQVFSVEPGIYIEGWGGVRFENLVTVKPHHDPAKAEEGWKEIDCLTFAPIDHNLLDEKVLDEQDFKLIEAYDKKVEANLKNIQKNESSL